MATHSGKTNHFEANGVFQDLGIADAQINDGATASLYSPYTRSLGLSKKISFILINIVNVIG